MAFLPGEKRNHLVYMDLEHRTKGMVRNLGQSEGKRKINQFWSVQRSSRKQSGEIIWKVPARHGSIENLLCIIKIRLFFQGKFYTEYNKLESWQRSTVKGKFC